jgi:hypothetical protein
MVRIGRVTIADERRRRLIRGGVALLSALPAIAVAYFVATLIYELRKDNANTACGRTPPNQASLAVTYGWHARWDWSPPGFVCVYTDRAGNVVAETRPP